jgi:hypothetical protein
MERLCEEPHCLQVISEHLFRSHQDQHFAERLSAEEYEQQKCEQNNDEALAQAIAIETTSDEATDFDSNDGDYLMALALDREFRNEEEERSFRNVQVFQRSRQWLIIIEERSRR